MIDGPGITRRAFLSAAAAAPAFASGSFRAGSKIGGFTKMLQALSFEETAEATAEIGWDGIECPTRPRGHVLPERVEEDLPRMAEALKKRDTSILVIATDVHHPGEPHTQKVLRTAAKLGIPFYRLGSFRYRNDVPIPKQLVEVRAQLRDLARLNKELGICGVFQNHSGARYVGAPVWDLYGMIKDMDPRYMGSHFDIGHATVEGGYSWSTNYRLIRPHIRAVVVKDFSWTHRPGVGGRAKWCPIGEGMISRKFFGMLKDSGFSGPITMHYEYEVEGEGREKIRNWIKAMKADTDTLREWVKG